MKLSAEGPRVFFDDGEKTVNDALVAIEGARATIAPMGANDSEFDTLAWIEDSVKTGNTDPASAIEGAQAVVDGKAADH